MAEFARKICKRFHAYLRMSSYQGQVYSVAEDAVYFQTTLGMISVLTNTHCLQPFSAVTNSLKPFPKHGLQEGQTVILENETITVPACGFTVDLSSATDIELSVDVMQTLFIPMDLNIRLRHLLRVIDAYGRSDDLSPLVTDAKSNPYVETLRPHLPGLHEALREQDEDGCRKTAALLAGCGNGWNPSSDDMLVGYMTAYAALSVALGRKRARVLNLTRAVASGAAEHTTDRSAAFLLQSGEGLMAEDVFQLLRSIFSDVSYPTMVAYATKVASFISVSGTDVLTGIYLAVTEHYGGRIMD